MAGRRYGGTAGPGGHRDRPALDGRFSPAQTWRILRQMGFSVQVPVPARRATERDEEAVATWTKETWPRVERR
ncbi:winged helix-turn-helix domain-containing protein [Streptomyces sp. NPDC048710]|uniref:helix-turn-helix domain-containing protein n=1 Tax=Streptomyces sp. NPDC048710 TaxID=3365586 RepID=UPI00371AC12A